MTTSKDMLEGFAEGNTQRGKLLTELFNTLFDIVMRPGEDPDVVTFAAQGAADIALHDSETEQREVANLIAVANSSLLTVAQRREAERRIAIMLGLNE